MRIERLAEIIDDLPYSIIYSGEMEELIVFSKEQADRVQELESFIDRFISSLSKRCLKEHVRKYKDDKKLMRTIDRQHEPPSYLSKSDKYALINLTKLFENVIEQNKRYRELLKEIKTAELNKKSWIYKSIQEVLEGDE